MTLTIEDFTPYLATPFAVAGNDSVAPFVLREATASPDRSGGQMPRPPFVLLFAVSDAMVRGQDMYTLLHPALGPIELFLVPIGRDDGAVLYEAVFN